MERKCRKKQIQKDQDLEMKNKRSEFIEGYKNAHNTFAITRRDFLIVIKMRPSTTMLYALLSAVKEYLLGEIMHRSYHTIGQTTQQTEAICMKFKYTVSTL